MEEESNHHVIDIWKVDEERLASMELKISENPKLLSKAAGNRSCSIFRVPHTMVEFNEKAYQPQIVSIGPYHRGQPRLNMIEEHKWRYLGSLLSRTKSKGLGLRDLLRDIGPLESEARECYSETIYLDSQEFTEMMVLDGCFILELFRRVGRLVDFERDDPLVTMTWILPFFYRDFLKLENQIPFFILHRLFELSKLPGEESTPTLSTLALEFFNNTLLRPQEVIVTKDQSDTNGKHNKHLLDLVRSSFVDGTEPEKRVRTPTHLINCVSKLRLGGIKITPGIRSESFLDVSFRDGVIEMATITVDDFMSSYLLNCVAYEQCYSDCSKHFTAYVMLLGCLITSPREVEYMCDRNIIENHFGTKEEVANFINNAGKEVAIDIETCYLSEFLNDVHGYYRNSWHVQWASFKYTYSFAAGLLLVLTVAQTYFAAYQYFSPQKS